MAGRRCPLACHTWPSHNEFTTCPACGQRTDYFPNADALPFAEAMSLKRHLEFDRHYEQHDAAADPARLLPGPDEARFDVPQLPEDWPVLDEAPR